MYMKAGLGRLSLDYDDDSMYVNVSLWLEGHKVLALWDYIRWGFYFLTNFKVSRKFRRLCFVNLIPGPQ